MAIVYWTMTTDPSASGKKRLTVKEIASVYKSGRLVWVVTYLYWTSFGTLTFFAAFMPTYLNDRWGIDGTEASTVYTSAIVICVALMRPLGGWLADRHNPIRLLGYMFGAGIPFVVALVAEASFAVQMTSVYALALMAGASAACVVKLIPSYFPHAVGAVSGLAKAAGAACGFTMSVTMAMSNNLSGGYTYGFAIWAVMNAVALLFVVVPGFWKRSDNELLPERVGQPALEAD